MNQKDLVRRVRERTVTVVDVRPREEYRARHISGAVSVLVRELRRQLRELPRSREIVASCGGRLCTGD